MNYKNDMYDEIQYGIYKSTKEKYSKKVNHKKNHETYSRKGKNKFSLRNIEF